MPAVEARSAREVTRLFQALTRHDPSDSHSILTRPAPALPPAEQLTIGVPGGFFFDRCDPEIEAAVRGALAEFRRWGHPVVDVDLSMAATAAHDSLTVAHAEALSTHRARLAERPTDFGPLTHARLCLGAAITATELDQVRVRTGQWRRQLARVFESVDILVTPTTQGPPPPAREG